MAKSDKPSTKRDSDSGTTEGKNKQESQQTAEDHHGTGTNVPSNVQEVLERILDDPGVGDEIRMRIQKIVAHQTHQYYEGPYPSLEAIQGYAEVDEESPNRIFAMAEKEQASRLKRADSVTKSAINAANEESSRAICGQIFGLVITLACVAGIVYHTSNGHYVAAGALAAVSMPNIISVLMSGRSIHSSTSKHKSQEKDSNGEQDNAPVTQS